GVAASAQLELVEDVQRLAVEEQLRLRPCSPMEAISIIHREIGAVRRLGAEGVSCGEVVLNLRWWCDIPWVHDERGRIDEADSTIRNAGSNLLHDTECHVADRG